MRWYYHQSPLLRHDSKLYTRPYILDTLHSLLVVEHPIDFNIYQNQIKFRSYGGLLSTHAYYVGEVEYHLVQYVVSKLKPNFIMFDIGAHHGTYTLIVAYELKKRGWKGLIHSFEPDPFNFSLLQYNVEQNQLTDYVVLHNKGVSNLTGKESFLVNTKENSDNMIGSTKTLLNQENQSEIYKQQELEVIKLDDFVGEISHVDMIKIDIQGGEYLALEGAKQLIEQNKPICLVEAVQGWATTLKVENILGDYNYSIKAVDTKGMLCERDSSDVFISWDWVAIPK
ncbi:MAG: FkbM family methyltransferase [Calothrix sp. SM1_7_51]|nr:FkbM family methyltransferase [Calothrix sp. SM1_7_51]